MKKKDKDELIKRLYNADREQLVRKVIKLTDENSRLRKTISETAGNNASLRGLLFCTEQKLFCVEQKLQRIIDANPSVLDVIRDHSYADTEQK